MWISITAYIPPEPEIYQEYYIQWTLREISWDLMHICTHISFDTVHEYESASGEKLSSVTVLAKFLQLSIIQYAVIISN